MAILVFLAGCGGADPEKTEKERSARAAEIAIPVRVVPAAGGTVIEGLSIQGRLEVWRHEILSAQAAGIIREFPPLPDQPVKAGELVLRLDPPLNEAEEVAIATTARDRAKRTVERLEYLTVNAPVTVSAHDLETARDALADADAKIATYRRKQEQRRLVAPFTGVLVKFQGVVGDTLAEGAKIGELLDSSRYRIRLELPETSLRRLSLGQTVEVRALSDDSKATGTVASIPGAIDAEKGTGQVVIDTTAPPPTWRPGGFATARLVLKESVGDVVLPREKVLYEENRPYCWLTETRDGKLVARRAWVELGAADETRLIITKGVQPGEQVIVEGLLGVSDGVRIEIKKDEVKPTDDAGKK